MGEMNKSLLADLLQLSKVDSALASILAEKKGFEKLIQEKSEAKRKSELLVQAKTKVAEEKRDLCRKEERSIADERSRLAERRKALKTLSTFKLQQAAEKEVDYGARQVSLREETLIKALGEAENLEKDLKATKDEHARIVADLEKAEAEARDTLVTLNEREARHRGDRIELAKKIDPAAISLYGRVVGKHAMNAVVAINKGTCSGCFMQVGPQVVVQISRGNALVRCPGCGRILYLPEEQTPEAAAQGK